MFLRLTLILILTSYETMSFNDFVNTEYLILLSNLRYIHYLKQYIQQQQQYDQYDQNYQYDDFFDYLYDRNYKKRPPFKNQYSSRPICPNAKIDTSDRRVTNMKIISKYDHLMILCKYFKLFTPRATATVRSLVNTRLVMFGGLIRVGL